MHSVYEPQMHAYVKNYERSFVEQRRQGMYSRKPNMYNGEKRVNGRLQKAHDMLRNVLVKARENKRQRRNTALSYDAAPTRPAVV
jgi:hypothetical protein